MSRSHLTAASLVTTLFTILALATLPSGAAEGVRRPGGGDPTPSAGRSPELSVARDLADRRSLVVGDRFWSMGAQDGSYPATGFHTRGEMGGFWTPPIKLLDGIWFRAGETWLTAPASTPAAGATSGWTSAPTTESRITRTDFAPDGLRAGLVGLRLDSARATTSVWPSMPTPS